MALEQWNQYKVKRLGSSCILLSFGEFSLELALFLKGLKEYLEEKSRTGYFVQAHSELALYHFPETDLELVDIYLRLVAPKIEKPEPKRFEIAARYGHPDLDLMASVLGLSQESIVYLHTSVEYVVGAIGFTPNFSYLWGLPPEIHFPRKQTPSKKVTAGSIGIGGKQTGIYPIDSPGGWHILGEVDPEVCCHLEIGDVVRFTNDPLEL